MNTYHSTTAHPEAVDLRNYRSKMSPGEVLTLAATSADKGLAVYAPLIDVPVGANLMWCKYNPLVLPGPLFL